MSACQACSRDQCDRCRGGSCCCCGSDQDKETDMLETEKATDRMDLPHEFHAGAASALCDCGRANDHRLHQPVTTEQAAHSAPLQTEKGTI